MLLASESTIEHPSTTITTKIVDKINNLRNTEVTDSSANDIKASIRTLINYCNSKFLKDFPIDVVCKLSNTLQIEINKSWYCPDLNLTNTHEYIISTFEELERKSYHTQIEASNRCLDIICALVDYFNVVVLFIVLFRRDRYLELQEKKLDELQSSKPIETSIHVVNGDDFHG